MKAVGAYAQARWRSWLAVALLVALALAVRLVVWRWREFYGLGGDESEYLAQALTLLQERRYTELRLMRPPLYTLFLAASILLVDSLVQNLRLVQAVVSALTVVPLWCMVGEIGDWGQGIGGDATASPNPQSPIPNPQFLACLLLALSYTLAANATELLSETLFLFGLTTVFWLLLRTARSIRSGEGGAWRWAAAAGLAVGLLCLIRSVAQPLLPLGALWLAAQWVGKGQAVRGEGREMGGQQSEVGGQREGARGEAGALLGPQSSLLGPQSPVPSPQSPVPSPQSPVPSRWLIPPFLFLLCALLVILPWTARNYATYGALILVDTTGAENLWLDNNPAASTPDDPLGREEAKRQLYALGEDRAARQRLATERGIAAISANPGWFASKAWGELLKLFALEYSDDMRARPAIWLPRAEVWTRLVLGDGLWLLILLGGVAGLGIRDWGLGTGDRRQGHGNGGVVRSPILRPPIPNPQSPIPNPLSIIHRLRSDPRLLFVPWLLYIVATAMLFHVELRYRLPAYPILIAYTAPLLVAPRQVAWRRGRVALAGLLVALCCGLTLLHRPYPALAWQLGWKHANLWAAERALAAGDAQGAEESARAAAALDERSALAEVALARAALLRADRTAAQEHLEVAISLQKAHPHAHLLLGDLLRAEGQEEAARRELAFETGSLEDLQGWSWRRFITPPAPRLDVGSGLDLGAVQGFYPAEEGGWRWTRERATLRLRAEGTAQTLSLRLGSGRPPGAPAPVVTVLVDGVTVGELTVGSGWQTYVLPLPPDVQGRDLVVELAADTFRPRSYDMTSGDGRRLGVMVDWVEVAR